MTQRRRTRVHSGGARTARYEEQIARWILRTLVRGGAARAYVTAQGELASEGARLLRGLGVAVPARGEQRGRRVLGLLRARLRQLERGKHVGSLATENARLLGQLLRLNGTERDLLAFVIALEVEDDLRECFAELHGRTYGRVCRQLALVLGRRVGDVERALRADGPLRSLPVLDFERADYSSEQPLVLSRALEGALMRPLASEQDLLRRFLTRAPAADLGLADYPHLAADVDLLLRYLRTALSRRKRGVNVLLHGPPGTGKTQLARAIAGALAAELYEVNLEDDDQDVHEGSARLGAYALGQRFLRGRRDTLLLLDEIEDVFPRPGVFSLRAGGGLTKGWTNRLLEDNATPAFWISNAIDQIDRAYVRRFDLVLEIAQPPQSVRRSLLERHARGLQLRPDYLDRLSELEELSPAHVQRAAALVRMLRPSDGAHAESDLGRVVDNNLRAFSGRSRLRVHGQAEVPYDLALLNVDVDVAALTAGVCRERRAALCFHGPPGTGKTELARFIARSADLPLHEHRASDLLGKYVGETEKQIARMFERAERDSALLLLDEADGFLADRAGAQHGWELTQVNELLLQMERFSGVFVCATNLVERLDRASLRRFSLKVGFGYLSSVQARALFVRVLALLGAPPPSEAVLAELDRLRVLTPGDFAAFARSVRLIDGPIEPRAAVRALAQACTDKRVRGGRALGFRS
jgi:transitional endoplasmic reticulum ATPase